MIHVADLLEQGGNSNPQSLKVNTCQSGAFSQCHLYYNPNLPQMSTVFCRRFAFGVIAFIVMRFQGVSANIMRYRIGAPALNSKMLLKRMSKTLDALIPAKKRVISMEK